MPKQLFVYPSSTFHGDCYIIMTNDYYQACCKTIKDSLFYRNMV